MLLASVHETEHFLWLNCRSAEATQQGQDRQSQQNLLEAAMASDASGHLDPSRAAAHKSMLIMGLDRGVWVAGGLITAWATMIHITVFHTPLHSLQAVALFWPMMQLHTG